MTLPPELVDENITQLPPKKPQVFAGHEVFDMPPLKKTVWERPYLYICRSEYNLWVDGISPSNVELLHHAYSLTYILNMMCGFTFWGIPSTPLGRIIKTILKLTPFCFD